MAAESRLADVPCLACGCLCDDIAVDVVDGRVARLERACQLGEQWFLTQREPAGPAYQIAGRVVPLTEACDRAADLLARAREPLLFGLSGTTCEAQRVAAALADRIGAVIDIGDTATFTLASAIRATDLVTATLGEVRHRADVVLFWRGDPATTHPRHLERYSLDCRGELTPRGRVDRTLIVVDTQPSPTSARADLFLEIPPGGDTEAIALLRACMSDEIGHSPPEADAAKVTPPALPAWREAARQILAGRYVAMFFDAARFPAGEVPGDFRPTEPGHDTSLDRGGSLAALLTLVRDLNRRTHCVALPLGGPGNPAGAEQVLTWQTGFPGGIRFASGYPQFDPVACSAAASLLDGRVDAALLVACDRQTDPLAALPGTARERLSAIPFMVLHTADVDPPEGAAVSIVVATPGIDAGGTVFRSDGVPLRLRPALPSTFPAAAEVLQTIAARIAARASDPGT